MTQATAGRDHQGGPKGFTLFLALALALATSAAWAQGIVVAPSLSIQETATSNRDVSSGNAQSDLISQVSPGVSIVARRGPFQGTLNYALNGLLYARESSLNSVHHTLAAAGRLEAFDGRAGLGVSASAGRQILSAFGTQGVDPSLNNANQAQTFSYTMSPYLTGRILGNVAYRANLEYSSSRTSGSSLGDSSSMSGGFSLGGTLGQLGWTASAKRQAIDSGEVPQSHATAFSAGVIYQPDVELQLSLRAGSETDDIRTGRSERTTTWGTGATWTPTPRTQIKVELDRRYFGRSHLLNFSHRMARVVLTASDARSVQAGGTAGRSTVSNYDLFFQQFASQEPDPARRDTLVRDYLQVRGLDPNALVVAGGFLTAGASLTRATNVSAAYQGIRTTLTMAFVRSATESLGASGNQGDLGATGRVRQQGFNVALSHRLTPDSSLVVALSEQRTPSEGLQAGNELRSITANWSLRLGQRATATLGLRHVSFDSESNPYTESALIGSLRMQF